MIMRTYSSIMLQVVCLTLGLLLGGGPPPGLGPPPRPRPLGVSCSAPATPPAPGLARAGLTSFFLVAGPGPGPRSPPGCRRSFFLAADSSTSIWICWFSCRICSCTWTRENYYLSYLLLKAQEF